MRYAKTTVTGVGSSPWVPFENIDRTFSVGYGCTVTGVATYTVEYTFDNVLLGETPTVFPNSSMTGITVNKDGNFIAPVNAMRVTITSGTGTVTAKILQSRQGG